MGIRVYPTVHRGRAEGNLVGGLGGKVSSLCDEATRQAGENLPKRLLTGKTYAVTVMRCVQLQLVEPEYISVGGICCFGVRMSQGLSVQAHRFPAADKWMSRMYHRVLHGVLLIHASMLKGKGGCTYSIAPSYLVLCSEWMMQLLSRKS